MAANSKQSESTDYVAQIIVVNPNSSQVITDALEKNLSPLCPTGIKLTFLTGPKDSPPSIIDPITSILSSASTFQLLTNESLKKTIPTYPNQKLPIGFLIACFSAHPLIPMLKTYHPKIPSFHILTSSILHSLSICEKFGILTSMGSAIEDCEKGVREVIGSGDCWKYVGTLATELGVVELQTGDKEKVKRIIKEKSRELIEKGADTIVLGCAGFSGMESVVRSAVKEGENPISVIDGAKAGIQLLAGILANNYKGLQNQN